jgi:TolB-like protein/tetratricopeptide (TPR) repeat protein
MTASEPPLDAASRRDRLFDEALALPPDQRAAFLEETCPDDPALRTELRSLVEAHEASTAFFEGLARDWVAPLHSAGVGGGSGRPVYLAPGSRVSRYEVIEVLGEGGMGVVYRARDPSLDRDVALKLLPPDALSDPEARAALVDEARRVARLDHPHVGVIHEVGETDDAGVFLAMACHEGETLADRLRGGPLPLPAAEIVRIGRGIAAALGAAHAAGIVHRDVKPSNVLLTRGDGLRLVDFGIAVATGEASAPRGSRGYASPELLSGAPADARTDLWSVGVLLHEMATGVRPPAPSKGLPALDALETGGTLPAGLVGVIRACLAPDPAMRPESAAVVLRMLGETAGARAAEAKSAQPGAWVVAGLVGVAAVALVALLPRGSDVQADAAGPAGATPWGSAARVLVLPFEDRTGDPALAMAGTMAADWITEGVSRAGIANVVDATSALAAIRETRDPVSLAGLHRADVVVTGGYYLERDSVRFTVQLVNGADGSLMRALDPIVGPRDDPLFAIEGLRQGAIAAVALHLDPRTTWHEHLVTETPPPWEAFLAYVRAKEHFIEGRWAEARSEAALAEAQDPTFYLAIFYGAIASANLGDWPDLEARRARLAPHAPSMNRPARLGLDFLDAILAGDHEASYRNHRRGVDEGILAPGTMGHAQLVQDAVSIGRFREAIEVAGDADPTRGELRGWFPYWGALTMAHHALGHFEEELRTARRAREVLNLRPQPLVLEARALAALGDLTALDAVVTDALRLHPAPSVFLRWTGDYLVLHGHPDEGRRRYLEAVARARADRARDPTPERDFHLAEALLALAAWGDDDRDAAHEARELFRGLRALNPTFIDPPAGLGRAAAILGDTAEAHRWSDHLARVEPRGRMGGHHYRRARIAALLGDADLMVDLLVRANGEGTRVQYAAREEAVMMRYRDHPAVAALLRPR